MQQTRDYLKTVLDYLPHLRGEEVAAKSRRLMCPSQSSL